MSRSLKSERPWRIRRGGGSVYVVNKTQYTELMRLEGQSMIRDDQVHFISGISQILQVKKRLKKNYIINPPA